MHPSHLLLTFLKICPETRSYLPSYHTTSLTVYGSHTIPSFLAQHCSTALEISEGIFLHVQVLQICSVRSVISHMLKTGRRNPSQGSDETLKRAKQSSLSSLKWERSQKMRRSFHWNKVTPKKHLTFFSPPKSQYNLTSTIIALLNR